MKTKKESVCSLEEKIVEAKRLSALGMTSKCIADILDEEKCTVKRWLGIYSARA